MKKNKIL